MKKILIFSFLGLFLISCGNNSTLPENPKQDIQQGVTSTPLDAIAVTGSQF